MRERRADPRRTAQVPARVAASPEQRLPRAETVDISRGGLLLAFAEPVGFPIGHRLVISLDLRDGHFYALGHVSRIERGDDFRTYVAMAFLNVLTEDYDELIAQLDALDHDRSSAALAHDPEHDPEHGPENIDLSTLTPSGG